MYHFILG